MPDAAAPDRPAGRGRVWLYAVLAVALAGAGVVVFRGCSVRQSELRFQDAEKVDADPWASVRADLARQPDVAGVRATLDRLNTALARNPAADQPAGLTSAGAALARQAVGLTDPDVNEIKSATYSGLDPHYVAECFYLRDAVRALDVTGLPPLRQAELVFAWVNRQVADRHWVTTDGRGQAQFMPPVPPAVVLTRGFGSGLERAYVFLAASRQLGLDGVFVGPPDAATRPWSYARTPSPTAPPAGPVWAAGVRVGPDVFLFDPWRGEPVPGPGGQGIATLAQVKATPDLLKPWRDDKTKPWDVPAADVAASTAFLAVPLSGLAPRFVRLERELKADAPPVRLAADLSGLRERFAAECKLPGLTAWNPPGEVFTYPRALAAFVPAKDGGLSPLPDLPADVLRSSVPADLVAGAAQLGAVERLQRTVIARYVTAFLDPPPPARERVARGAYAEVVPALVKKLKEFQEAQERLRTDRKIDEAAVRAFAADAQAVEAKKREARDREGGAAGPLAAAAQQAEADLYRVHAAVAGYLVDQAVADAGAAEATFLTAAAMHERAERAQTQADRPGAQPDAASAAAGAWAEARGWWDQYRPYASTQGAARPERAALATRLTVRAERYAGGR